MESNSGGSLPVGSINLGDENSISVENWVATTPEYTDWVNYGAVKNCGAYGPAEITQLINTSYTKIADCQQDQIRDRQDREIETNSSQLRNVGSVIQETQTITSQLTQSAVGQGLLNSTGCFYQAIPSGMEPYGMQSPGTYALVDITKANGEAIGVSMKEGGILTTVYHRTTWSYTSGGYRYTLGAIRDRQVFGSATADPVTADLYELCRTSI